MDNLLEIKKLKTYFKTESKTVKAVHDVSLNIQRGDICALVGESGCGKSMTALSILRLIPDPPGKILGGEVWFHSKHISSVDLLTLSENQMRSIRGNRIAMIFQEPMTSLNPVFTVGNQIMEAIILHQKVSQKGKQRPVDVGKLCDSTMTFSENPTLPHWGFGKKPNKKEARTRAIEMLKKVGIPNPEKRIDDYPHQMSGGMRQRVMIAMALSCHPELLIADEPTTALDVTIQAQILDLMHQLIADMGMSLLLITHDLGIVAEHAKNVSVMYAGQIIEQATVKEIYTNPKHPYTQGLLESIPSLKKKGNTRLKAIPGSVPNLARLPKGCAFQDRCSYVIDDCRMNNPGLFSKEKGHQYRCFHPL